MARLFWFAARLNAGSASEVKRHLWRYFFGLALLLATGFALWSWFRPYDWHPDPTARCQVVQTLVSKDRSFYWLEVRLKMNPMMIHDLEKKVILKTSSRAKIEAADSTFTGADPQVVSDLWFKFWLEPEDFSGPMTLFLNDGALLIKAQTGMPKLGFSGSRTFSSNQW